MNKITAEILEQGHNEYRKARYEKALSIYQLAEKQEPGNPSSIGYIGLALLSMGEYEKARSYLRTAYESDDEGVKFLAQLHLGIVDYKTKNYKGTIELLSEFRNAISHFDTIKENIAPNSEEERIVNRFAVSCYWLGLADYEQKNYFNAILDMTLYKNYTRHTPNITADIVTIESYAIRFEVDEAEEHLKNNIERIQSGARFEFKIGQMYDTLSHSFDTLGNPGKAVHYANEAINSFIVTVNDNSADITTVNLAKKKLENLTLRLG